RPLEVVVRRVEGDTETTVAAGPSADWPTVPDRPGDVYRVYLREATAGDSPLSSGVEAPCLEPAARQLCPYAEGDAGAATADGEPARVALLFRALPWDTVADGLLHSSSAAVRLWTTRHVLGGAQQKTAEPLLWRALQDEQAEIRRLAVDGLLTAPV